MNETEILKKAIEDVALIKRVIIDSKKQSSVLSWSEITTNTNLFINVLVFALAVLVLALDCFMNGVLTNDFIYSRSLPNFQLLIIFQTGISLIALIFVLYFIVFKASKSSSQPFTEYMLDNFGYLTRLNLITDLLIKFSIYSLIILSQKPEFVFPLFFLFIAEFCFNGRLFVFPIRLGMGMGLLNLFCALGVFYFGLWSFAWPLVGFLCTAGVSILAICKIKKEI